jgi:hypothetical protein
VADHAPYTEAELDELEQLDLAARAAPWGWFGNAGCHEVHLATPDRGRIYVMGFARWGMRGAQPVFQVKRSGIGLMEPAAGMLQFEVPYRKDIVGIDHPDARLIPAARNALPRLLAEVRRLRAIARDADAFLAGGASSQDGGGHSPAGPATCPGCQLRRRIEGGAPAQEAGHA